MRTRPSREHKASLSQDRRTDRHEKGQHNGSIDKQRGKLPLDCKHVLYPRSTRAKSQKCCPTHKGKREKTLIKGIDK